MASTPPPNQHQYHQHNGAQNAAANQQHQGLASGFSHSLAAAPMPPPALSVLNPNNALAKAMADYSLSRPSTATEYYEHFRGKIDALKAVLEFPAAQHNMEIFSSNPAAEQIYTRIISAGLRELFGDK